jgi:hypothetical protein
LEELEPTSISNKNHRLNLLNDDTTTRSDSRRIQKMQNTEESHDHEYEQENTKRKGKKGSSENSPKQYMKLLSITLRTM